MRAPARVDGMLQDDPRFNTGVMYRPILPSARLTRAWHGDRVGRVARKRLAAVRRLGAGTRSRCSSNSAARAAVIVSTESPARSEPLVSPSVTWGPNRGARRWQHRWRQLGKQMNLASASLSSLAFGEHTERHPRNAPTLVVTLPGWRFPTNLGAVGDRAAEPAASLHAETQCCVAETKLVRGQLRRQVRCDSKTGRR